MKKSSLLMLCYSLFLIFTVFLSYSFLDPSISYLSFVKGARIDNRDLVTTLYIVIVSLFIVFFLLFLRQLSFKQGQASLLKKILLTSMVLVFSYPAMLSYDIYNYIATAKVTFFYGENPYIVMPIEIIGDPLFSFMHAANKTALYGPVWILLTAIPFFLSSQFFPLTLVFFKMVVIGFYLGTVLLLWKMTKNVYHVSLFALHPLVLIETFISSHNDIVMMFFALLSLYLLREKKFILSGLLLLASILIKFATLALVPAFFYVVLKILSGKAVNWERVYRYGFFAMLAVFLLSFLREEIYPWYGIWFLVFIPIIQFSKNIKIAILVFTFSLMFRYVPYLFFGTHFGITPYLKWIVTFAPVSCYLLLTSFHRKWART